MTRETRLEQTDAGLAPATEGWFVLNVRDAVCGGAFRAAGVVGRALPIA